MKQNRSPQLPTSRLEIPTSWLLTTKFLKIKTQRKSWRLLKDCPPLEFLLKMDIPTRCFWTWMMSEFSKLYLLSRIMATNISPPYFLCLPSSSSWCLLHQNYQLEWGYWPWFSHREGGRKEIPWVGKIVNFKVLEALSHHPEIRTYDIESRNWIRVESEEPCPDQILGLSWEVFQCQ